MAYLKADGFETYGDDETKMLVQWVQNAQATLLSGQGRNGGYALQISSNASTAVRMTFGVNATTFILAFAFKFPTTIPSSSTGLSVDLLDNAGTVNACLIFGSDGSLIVKRGTRPSGTIIAQSDPDEYAAGAWYFLELKMLASQTVGTVEIRINGVTVASASGLDTIAGANVEFSQARWDASSSGGATVYIDDWFILDDTGSYLNDFTGDREVLEQVCDADGADADWTPSAGSDSYAMLDDIPNDGDTTYVESAVVGDRCGVTFPDVPAGYSAVDCVEIFHVSRKTSPGDGSIAVTAISNGTESAVAADDAMTETYQGWRAIFETDPDTNLPWSLPRASAVTAVLERSL